MMDVEWKNPKRGQRFDWVCEGDTFEYNGEFFIKVAYAENPEVGAVCLHNGHRHHFDASTLVTPVKIKAYAEEV